MQSFSYSSALMLLIMIVLATPGWTQPAASSLNSLDETAAFTGELVRNHATLLKENDLKELDEMNRSLRELQTDRKKANLTIAEAEGQRRLNDAAARLVKILETFPVLVRVTLRDQKPHLDIDRPIPLPGDEGSLLFKITQEGEDLSWKTVMHDFAEKSTIQFPLAAAGTTWALVRLQHVPAEMITVPVKMELDNKESIDFSIQIQIPAFGHLKVSVLSSETGESVPAMMQMLWKTEGKERPPGNAIEFAPQFDKQGNPSGNRRAQLAGKLAGNYWCVPRPFEMTVPPGDWQITIRRGVEHVPVFETFHVAPGESIVKTYTPERWVDMRTLGWYSGDDHVHCQILSDGDAERLSQWVRAEDVHVANVVKMGDIYRTWFEQRGWGKEYRVTVGDTVLSPGQECPRTHNELGHTMEMNTKEMIRDTSQYFLYDKVFDQSHAQGGLSGYCHVLFDMFHVNRDMSINIPKNKVDFVEIMQFAQLGTNLYYDFLNLGFKVTAAAGSDVPWGGTVGEVRMYAYLGNTPFDADAWFEAVRAGRTFVSNGPMIDFTVDGAHPGGEITVNDNRLVHVKARAWGDKRRFVPTRLEVIAQGEVLRSVDSSDPEKNEISLTFATPAAGGFWIAAKVMGSDGSYAHTTPVYVKRLPLRFWKYAAVDELIAKRLKSLAEVEEMVADYTRQAKENPDLASREIQQMALQGPDLLKRVAEARAIYQDLQRTAAEEKAFREKIQ